MIKWLAPANPFDCQPASPQRAILIDCFQRVLGTRRYVPTGRGRERRNTPPVEADKPKKKAFHGFPSPRSRPAERNALRMEAVTSCVFAVTQALLATITTSYPGSSSG